MFVNDTGSGEIARMAQVCYLKRLAISLAKSIIILSFCSNLWYFVSKFTEFDAKKLFKIYRHTLKKQQGGENDDKTKLKEDKEGHSHHKKKQKDKDKLREEVVYPIYSIY